jgi:hypothetical protein
VIAPDDRESTLEFAFGDEGDASLQAIHRGQRDVCVAFRIPTEMLARVDTLCGELNLTRSRLFQRSLMEYMATSGDALVLPVRRSSSKAAYHDGEAFAARRRGRGELPELLAEPKQSRGDVGFRRKLP